MIRHVIECTWERNGTSFYKTKDGLRFLPKLKADQIGHSLYVVRPKKGFSPNSNPFPRGDWAHDLKQAFFFNTIEDAEESRQYVMTGTHIRSVVLIKDQVWVDQKREQFEQLDHHQLTSILSRYSVQDCLSSIPPEAIKNWGLRWVWKIFSWLQS